MQPLTFGPFLRSNDRSGAVDAVIQHSGFDLEFTHGTAAIKVCIYRRVVEYRPTAIEFDDYVFHEDETPCDFTYLPLYTISTSTGRYFPLNALLMQLFTDSIPFSRFESFLADFRTTLPITKSSGGFARTHSHPEWLRADLAQRGFAIGGFFSYGRTLTVDLAWLFPQDRPSGDGPHLGACIIEFKPQPDRTLGRGKWIVPREGYFPRMLQKLIRSLEPKAEKIFSDEGRQMALEAFEWTPLTLMTSDQARTARIEFVRKNPALLDHPRDLATALRNEKLYSENTGINKIVKTLPSIIAAARSQP